MKDWLTIVTITGMEITIRESNIIRLYRDEGARGFVITSDGATIRVDDKQLDTLHKYF